MRYLPRALLAGGLGFALSWLVACGGGAGLLSGSQNSRLNNQLDAVSSAVDAKQCGPATRAVSAFSRSVTNLPATISPTLRTNLLQGASTVDVLAQRDCRTTTTTPTTTTTTTTTTSTPSTTTPSTSTSTTTTTPSTTSTTPATSSTTTGTTSTTGGSGGAGIGGVTGGGAGSGGAGAGGNGNGG